MEKVSSKDFAQKNTKSFSLVAYIMCITNPTLILLFLTGLQPDYGEASKNVGILVNIIDFLFFVSVAIMTRLNPEGFNRLVTPIAYFGCLLVFTNTSIHMASTNGGENLLLIAIEIVGFSVLLHDYPKRLIPFFLAITSLSGFILYQGGYSLPTVAQPMVALVAIASIISFFRYRVDIQNITNMRQNLALEKAYQKINRAKLKMEEHQMELVQQARSESVIHLARGVAHEVNNPLAIISGSAEVLISKFESGHGTKEDLIHNCNRIQSQVERIASIAKSLRILSGDHLYSEFHQLSIEEQVNALTTISKEIVAQHNINFLVEGFSPELIEGIYPVGVLQVLEALVKNAVDAVKKQEQPWIKLEIHVSDSLSFLVSDSGAGIPEEIQHTIFDPFFSTKSIGYGKGIGLTESRAIAKSMNGELRYDKHAEYTSFLLVLPLVAKSIA